MTVLGFADCAEVDEFLSWNPKTEIQKELRDIQIEVQGLQKSITQERNRKKCHLTSEFVVQSIQTTIDQLLVQIKLLRKEMLRIIKSDAELFRMYKVLMNVKGFGEVTVTFLLSKVDFNAFKKGAPARQICRTERHPNPIRHISTDEGPHIQSWSFGSPKRHVLASHCRHARRRSHSRLC